MSPAVTTPYRSPAVRGRVSRLVALAAVALCFLLSIGMTPSGAGVTTTVEVVGSTTATTATTAAPVTVASTTPTSAPSARFQLIHTADQTTAISPGGAVTFTIELTKTADAPVERLRLEIDYDEAVFRNPTPVDVALRSAIDDDGDKAVIDLLAVPGVAELEVGDSQSISYQVAAATSFPAGATLAESRAVVLVDGVRAQPAPASVPLAAAAAPVGFSEAPRVVTELEARHVLWIMGMLIGLAGGAVLAIVWASLRLLPNDAEGAESVADRWARVSSNLLSSVAVMVIATAVILLAVRGTIGEDGAVSILAGIAGYVLGRSGS
jgi:hypothetical protein